MGFDIERHDYGTGGYPGQLVLQDVITLHGAQFRNAAVIVASPPCQAYSYRAMPWKRAKALPPPSNELFDACFRIQREANEANRCAPNGDCMDCDGTGNFYRNDEDGDFLPCDTCGGEGQRRYIPLVVENVKGAQPWVGRAAWHYGSFYLWGDVPALMPISRSIAKIPGQNWNRFKQKGEVSPHWRMEAVKNNGGSWLNVAHNTESGCGKNPVHDAVKGDGGSWFGNYQNQKLAQDTLRRSPDADAGSEQGGEWWHDPGSMTRRYSSKSKARKAASAAIAKIPFPLANHIARVYKP